MTQIQQQMKLVQQQIIDNAYYEGLYNKCLTLFGMSRIGIQSCSYSDSDIVSLANSFWMALPDNTSIRRQPFFQLCDIAESCFDE